MISKLLPLTYAPLAALRNVTIAFILMGMPALAEPVTLVALGDSLTEGYGLPPDQGLVPQLQAWLTTQGAEVTVVNAGVSGDTTAGGVSRLDWTKQPNSILMPAELSIGPARFFPIRIANTLRTCRSARSKSRIKRSSSTAR